MAGVFAMLDELSMAGTNLHAERRKGATSLFFLSGIAALRPMGKGNPQLAVDADGARKGVRRPPAAIYTREGNTARTKRLG